MGGFGQLSDMFSGLMSGGSNLLSGIGNNLFGGGQPNTMAQDVSKLGGGGNWMDNMTAFGQNGSQGFINGGLGALADLGNLYGGIEQVRLGKQQAATQRQIANINQQQQADAHNRGVTGRYLANGAGFMENAGYGTLADYQDANRMNTTKIV